MIKQKARKNVRVKTKVTESDYIYNYYFKDIAKIPLLDKQTERESIAKAQQGDIEARNKVVTANQRFIVQICKQYLNRGIPFEDLISEANFGLMRAIEKFDLNSGNQFLTYAVWWIRQAIMITFSQKNRLIRLPAHRSDQACKIEKLYAEYVNKYGVAPTSSYIAQKLNLKEKDVVLMLSCIKKPLSFESTIDEHDNDSMTLGEVIADDVTAPTESVAEYNNLKEIVSDIMDDTLDAKEKEVLTKRFGLNDQEVSSLNEVGKNLGLTKERVRQIQNNAIKKFRLKSNVVKLKDFA